MAKTAADMLAGMTFMPDRRMSKATAAGAAVAESAVEILGGLALGEVHGRYAHLDGWKGKLAKHSPEILGGVGKVAQAICIAAIGPGVCSGIAGALGGVGLTAIGLDLGLAHARKDLGFVVVKVPAGTDVKKLKRGDAVPASTAVGALPAAAAGHGLAWDHIQDLASSH